MKIVGLLSWFDEDPVHLQELVESLGAHGDVDHLAAVDGPYRLYPPTRARPRSSAREYKALRDTCMNNQMGLTVHTAPTAWRGNEVEKRTFMFRLGHAIAEPYDDWLWVIDADEVVVRAAGLRETLEQTDLDVGSLLEAENGTPQRRERRLFRAHPKGISVERAHFYYRNGDGDVLWGPRQVPSVPLDVEVFHRPLARSAERNAARNGYYDSRRDQRAEAEVF
jgi:hypothetical protein